MEELVKALMSTQEELKELTAEFYALETRLSLVKEMVKAAAVHDAKGENGSMLSWPDIAFIMEWTSIQDRFNEVRANRGESQEVNNE